jgi:hypothetical protein
LGSGKIDMFLPTDFMRRIPGLLDERRVPGEVQYERLMQDVRERGFLPDQDRNRIVLGINHRGEPFIIEGNTRTAVASDLGIPNVRVEVRYKNGGEMVDGPFAPQNIARIAARGPEGFAQGGEVMMRSNMPEQLHRGIGSLNEVARGMYRGGAVQGFQMGGAVGGHPLDQYGQYLAQTYAQPIQQSASDAVNQFVDSVRQKEQSYFGGGAMGGGGLMGSPMQGGLMGSSANAGSTLAVGGLSPPMGQVGALSGNPMQAAMQSGTFDAQVAAAANTPATPFYMIGQRAVDSSGNEATGGGGGVPQIPFAAQQPGGMQMGAFNAAQARNPAPAPNPSDPYGAAREAHIRSSMNVFGGATSDGFVERRAAALAAQASQPAATRNFGPSPFGNSASGNANLFNARLADQNPFGAPPSTDNPLGRLSGLQANSVFSSMFSTGQRPSLNPLVERQGLV